MLLALSSSNFWCTYNDSGLTVKYTACIYPDVNSFAFSCFSNRLFKSARPSPWPLSGRDQSKSGPLWALRSRDKKTRFQQSTTLHEQERVKALRHKR